MKKQIIATAVIIMAALNVKAQDHFLGKTSVEASYGAAVPLSPANFITRSNYISFSNFQGGVSYQINSLWGVRGTYAYQQFQDKDNTDLGVQFHKFVAEATFKILEAVNPQTSFVQKNIFDVVAHAGIGGTFATRSTDSSTNKIGNLQIGIKPTYLLSDRFGIFLDGTYIMNFNQAYAYNGKSINGGTTGSYVTAAVGLEFRLGN